MEEEPQLAPIGDEIELGWLDDKQILIFRMHSNSRMVVDLWAKTVLELGSNYTNEKPYLALYDIRTFKFHMSITPWVQQRVAEVGRAQSHLHGRYAFVVNKSPLLQIWHSFLNHYVKRLQPRLEGRIFFDWDSALEWLRELT